MKLRLFGVGLLSGLLVAGGAAVGDDKPFTDAEFVKKAGSSGVFEVKSGELAQSKAANDLVKKFGERMVKDHTKANEELKTAAQAAGLTVPEKMDEKCQECYDKLANQSGAAFDKMFMDEQVKAHEEAVALFKKATTEARNPQLKEFATKTLPHLEEHLKMAKEIQTQVSK
jgi:putative membrane protein